MGMAAAESPSTCASCGAETRDGFGCLACLLRLGFDETLSDESGATALQPLPNQFGHYAIASHPDGSAWELGRGAMGVTFCAIDTSLQRKVALKIIKTDLAARSAEARERFMREARAAAALRHENVATVYEFGVREETGQCYYAMELVEGETLEERVRRTGPLDVRTTIAIGQQVSAALSAAEKRGLVHRDLKPANLMLIAADDETAPANQKREARNLIVKIIDFGLAKALKAEADPMTLTRNGFVGTPAFASPEQFDNAPLDVRSDIYSLGVTLWFSLTGKTPFTAPSLDEIRRTQQSQVLPVDQLKAARVPLWMISLLKSMLASEPAARPGLTLLGNQLRRGAAQQNILRPRSSFALAAIAVVLGAVAFFFSRSPHTSNSNTRAAPSETSLAVLPFINLSREADGAYFVNGIRSQIIARLSKVAALELVSDSYTHRFEGSKEDVGQIAAALGVITLLQGGVEKNGDNFRVEARLTDAQKHVDLWSQSYERTFSQIPQVESEVAGQVAKTLGVKLTEPESAAINAATTSNPKAYEAYLKGRSIWLERTNDNYRQAKKYFDQAIVLDPNYADAYAGLADAYQFMGASDFNLANRKENYEKARRACQRALELDPSLAEAHASLGLIAMNYDWDWALAGQELQRAMTLAPSNGLIHDWYAEYLMAIGKSDESMDQIVRARDLDPFSLVINSDFGKLLFFSRRYDEAEAQFKETLRMYPDFPDASNWLGQVYTMVGRYDDAIREFSLLYKQSGDGSWAAGERAYAYGMAGRKAEAQQALDAIKNALSRGLKIDKLPLAYAYLGVGDKDQAIACLEQDYEAHSTTMTSLRSHPLLDLCVPTRDSPP
jgi:serine/threonine protein kinase/tetratricopeptide (TPR) repeat protein